MVAGPAGNGASTLAVTVYESAALRIVQPAINTPAHSNIKTLAGCSKIFLWTGLARLTFCLASAFLGLRRVDFLRTDLTNVFLARRKRGLETALLFFCFIFMLYHQCNHIIIRSFTQPH